MTDLPRPTRIGLTRRSEDGQRGYLDGLRAARFLVAAAHDTTDAVARLDLVIEAMAPKEAAEALAKEGKRMTDDPTTPDERKLLSAVPRLGAPACEITMRTWFTPSYVRRMLLRLESSGQVSRSRGRGPCPDVWRKARP